MELRDYLRIVRKHWILIVLLTLLGVGLGALQTIRTTPVYQSQATVYVSFNTSGDTGSGELVQGVTYAQRAISSYIDVTETAIVTNRVATELNGEFTPSDVAEKVTATAPKDTTLIQVSATDSDPEAAALLANTSAAVLADVVANQLETPTDGGQPRVQMEIINPAEVPAGPISPNPTRNLALGLLLGLMLGLGAAVLIDVLDTKVRSRNDVAAITHTPVIGDIPDDPLAKTEPLLRGDDSLSPRSEPFRTLRTNLQFLDVEGNPRSFVVTSSLPSEGKTTVSSNLAITLAETGAKVALVEADLRKPRLGQYMGLEGAVGLTDLLIGKATFETALQRWGRQQLFVLPAGQIPPNPSELLGSKAMQQVLQTLDDHFDYVIIDAPPTLLVTDAAVVGQYAGGLLVVAASGQTKKQELAGTIETLHSAKARILGIILTMVPTKGPDAYRYGTYSYQQYVDVASPIVATRSAAVQPGGKGANPSFKPVQPKPLMEQ